MKTNCRGVHADPPPADGDATLPDEAWRRRFRRRLLAWFRHAARDLPWRENRDPYRVWVSEIMLQQTQVATVEPYFRRFMAKFPTLADLAAAEEHDVLKLWEGLGYYRRARQLHAAARLIVRDYGSAFPHHLAEAVRLPGIGRYTAGAILSIAYDARQPILEANTVRLYSRLLAFGGDPATSEGRRVLWTFAEEVLPRRGSGTLNQALMELGATVCTPKAPRCDACPVVALCPTHAHGLQHTIPRPKKKMSSEAVREMAVVVRRRGRVLLRRCGDGERWAGLWDFPRFAVEAKGVADLESEAAANVRRLTGVDVEMGERLATIQHGVTRFRITLECRAARYVSGRLRGNGVAGAADLVWVKPETLDQYALSTTGRKIGRLLIGIAGGAAFL
jgi:A/G-specific adenine glycosylase